MARETRSSKMAIGYRTFGVFGRNSTITTQTSSSTGHRISMSGSTTCTITTVTRIRIPLPWLRILVTVVIVHVVEPLIDMRRPVDDDVCVVIVEFRPNTANVLYPIAIFDDRVSRAIRIGHNGFWPRRVDLRGRIPHGLIEEGQRAFVGVFAEVVIQPVQLVATGMELNRERPLVAARTLNVQRDQVPRADVEAVPVLPGRPDVLRSEVRIGA